MSFIYKSLSNFDGAGSGAGAGFGTASKDKIKLEKQVPPRFTPPQEDKKSPSLAGIKIAIIFSFLLSMAALAGAVFLYTQIETQRGERESVEASQVDLQEKYASLENLAEGYRDEISRMRDQLKSYLQERDQFKQAIEDNRSVIDGLEADLTSVKEKNQTVEDQVARLQDEVAPVAFVTPAPESDDFTAEELAGAETVIDEGGGRIQIKDAAPAAPSAASNSPKVLTVNRKFNFVVLSLGLRDGLKMGEGLDIVREGKVIGKVQVEKLYEAFAAAAVIQEPKKAPITEGDLVERA